MLSVANKPVMLSGIMLNVVMLSVVMLNVIAPTQEGQDSGFTIKILARQKITIM
jgi:hypothetical protein